MRSCGRSCLAAVLVLVAVLFRRPEAVVLAAPFGVFAVWAAVNRPAGQPQVSITPGAPSLLEGQATSLRIAVTDLDPRVDLLTAVVPRNRWFELDPPAGGRSCRPARPRCGSSWPPRTLRWGRRKIDATSVVASSMLGGYRTEPIRTTDYLHDTAAAGARSRRSTRCRDRPAWSGCTPRGGRARAPRSPACGRTGRATG